MGDFQARARARRNLYGNPPADTSADRLERALRRTARTQLRHLADDVLEYLEPYWADLAEDAHNINAPAVGPAGRRLNPMGIHDTTTVVRIRRSDATTAFGITSTGRWIGVEEALIPLPEDFDPHTPTPSTDTHPLGHGTAPHDPDDTFWAAMRRDHMLYTTDEDLPGSFTLDRATHAGNELDRPAIPLRFAAPLPGRPRAPHLGVDVTMGLDEVLRVEYNHGHDRGPTFADWVADHVSAQVAPIETERRQRAVIPVGPRLAGRNRRP